MEQIRPLPGSYRCDAKVWSRPRSFATPSSWTLRLWCNGNTSGFGPVDLGSTPGRRSPTDAPHTVRGIVVSCSLRNGADSTLSPRGCQVGCQVRVSSRYLPHAPDLLALELVGDSRVTLCHLLARVPHLRAQDDAMEKMGLGRTGRGFEATGSDSVWGT